MSGHDQHQRHHSTQPAGLLDAYWARLRQAGAARPPDGLDPDLAALAAALERELRPPEPSATFVRALQRQLHAESGSATTSHGLPLPPIVTAMRRPSGGNEPPASPPPPATPSRRRWTLEAAKLVAGVLVFVLVAGLLIALFGAGEPRDGTPTAGRSDSGPTATPALVAPGVAQGSALTPPAAAPRPGELLVTWDPTGGPHHKLYVLSTDGSEPRKLTPGPEDSEITELGGSWSPDGTRVAFAAGTEGSWQIYVIDADDRDGSSLRPIGPAFTWVEWPRWSPDATRLLFAGQRDGSPGIFTLDVSTAEVLKLTDTSDLYYSPTWSPDGARILYGKYPGGMARFGALYSMNADGSDKRPLPGSIGFDPQWSPTGNALAYTYQLRFGTYVLVLPVDAMYETPPEGTVAGLRLTAEGLSSWNPRWSPAGDGRLAYVATDMGGSIAGIFIHDDTGTTQVSDLTGAFEWSPDGQRLAVISERMTREGQVDTVTLTLVNTDGSGERQLFTARGLGSYLAWRPQPTTDAPVALPQPTPAVPTSPDFPERIARLLPLRVLVTDDPPPIGVQDAMQALADVGIPWALGGTWEGRPVTIDAAFGLVTVTDGTTHIPLNTGEVLEHVTDRAAWVIDYGNVQGIIPSIAPGTAPPPRHDHAVYVVDAATRSILFIGSYRSDSPDTTWPTPVKDLCAISRPPIEPGIFVVDVATGQTRTLVPTELGIGGPAIWSPDSASILFVMAWSEPSSTSSVTPTPDNAGRFPTPAMQARIGIYRDTLDGNPPILLVETEQVAALSWSPDGAQLAFLTSQTGAYGWQEPQQVWVVNADGSGLRPLDIITPGGGHDHALAWLPDGLRVVWVDEGDIWLVQEGDAGPSNLTRSPEDEVAPTVGPRGDIVFQRWSAPDNERDFPYLLYAVPSDGGDAQPLDAFLRGDTDPQWTPDGAWVTVSRDGDIWVMRADGSDARNMTWHAATDNQPRWSPDGSRLLFRSYRSNGPLQVRREQGQPHPIVLRAAGQAQPGMQAVTCWSTPQSRTVTGSEVLPFATDPLVVDTTSPVQLDLTALGDPTAIAISVYDIAATRANGKGYGDDALVLPCAAPGGTEAACHIFSATLEPRAIVDLNLPLPPSDYVIVVHANIVAGDERGYVEQSFRERVE
jgi:Tol biopolymer transport system component